MKVRLLTVLLAVFSVAVISCHNEPAAQGTLRISYIPHITQNIAESYYWYLYPSDNYPNLPYLQKGGFSGEESSYDTNSAMVTTEIKGLNPGNYVFRYYYRDQKQQVHTVQVSGGTTNVFVLKNSQ
jgi:hypothetical protein